MSRRDTVLMIVLVAAGAAITIIWGERIGIHHGEGWDGEAYAAWARNFPHAVLGHGVTAFQSERVLPSAILYCTFGVLGIARTDPHVLLGFQILDAAALVAAAVALTRIAALLGWSRAAAWAAFAATFLGFATARAALYYPAETDPTAFALAMTVVWAYLAYRPVALGLAVLAGAFTWPALLAPGFALLVLPRTRGELPATTGRWHRPLALAVALASAATIIGTIEYVLAHPAAPGGWGGAQKFLGYAHLDLKWLTIGYLAISTALAAYFVARDEHTWSVWPYLRRVGWLRIAAGVAAAIAIVVLGHLWSNRVGTRGPGFTWRDLRNYYAVNALHGPLWSPVHQVVYFGPIVLVAIAAWPKIAVVVPRWGPGATLVLGMIVLAAVNCDGRQLTHLMPFMIVATITATASFWTVRRTIGFAVLGFGWSKLWLHIGYNRVHVSREWPDLRWFMQQGPWATDQTFLWHLGGVVVTAVALVLLARSSAASR